MQRARSRLAGHLMEHRLPSLCGKLGLKPVSLQPAKSPLGAQAGMPVFPKSICPLRGVARVIDLRGWNHRARARGKQLHECKCVKRG